MEVADRFLKQKKKENSYRQASKFFHNASELDINGNSGF
jgi:hypothetical protein